MFIDQGRIQEDPAQLGYEQWPGSPRPMPPLSMDGIVVAATEVARLQHALSAARARLEAILSGAAPAPTPAPPPSAPAPAPAQDSSQRAPRSGTLKQRVVGAVEAAVGLPVTSLEVVRLLDMPMTSHDTVHRTLNTLVTAGTIRRAGPNQFVRAAPPREPAAPADEPDSPRYIPRVTKRVRASLVPRIIKLLDQAGLSLSTTDILLRLELPPGRRQTVRALLVKMARQGKIGAVGKRFCPAGRR